MNKLIVTKLLRSNGSSFQSLGAATEMARRKSGRALYLAVIYVLMAIHATEKIETNHGGGCALFVKNKWPSK